MPITIKGSASLVIKKLTALPASIDRALGTGLARGLEYAASVAQLQFLSGPRPAVLNARTGRLRGSIAYEVDATNPARIVGRIGSNLSYAAFHEFGFHGIINVRAHSRILNVHSVKTGAQVEIRRKLYDDKGNFIGFRDSNKRALERLITNPKHAAHYGFNVVQVRAYSRKVDYFGRPYIRPALETAMPTITGEINREIKAL